MNRHFIDRTTNKLTITIVSILLAGSCKEEMPPPGPDNFDEPVQEIDFAHAAQVSGDSRLAIPNLLLVIQRDRVYTDQVDITLLSTNAESASARMLFGSMERMSADQTLKGIDIRFGGARFFNVSGNGIFTRTAAYQPKFIVLHLSDVDDEEVNGSITGDFYRFNPALPTEKPRVVKLDVAFTAKLYVK